MSILARTFALGKIGRRTYVSSYSTISELLDAKASTLPHREIVRSKHENINWSISDLAKHSNALANGLSELGLKKGDVLSAWLPNELEHVVALFAAARLGLVFSPIDFNVCSQRDIRYVLEDSKSSTLIFSRDHMNTKEGDELITSIFPELLDTKMPLQISNSNLPSMRYAITNGYDDLDTGILNIRNVFMYNDAILFEKLKEDVKDDKLVFKPYWRDGSANLKREELSGSDLLDRVKKITESVAISRDNRISLNSLSPSGVTLGVLSALINETSLVLSSRFANEDIDTSDVTLLDDKVIQAANV